MKNIWLYASIHTFGERIFEKSGVTYAFSPTIAPSRFTAHATRQQVSTKSVGMNILFAISIPPDIPRNTMHQLISHTTARAARTGVLKPPSMAGDELTCRNSLKKKVSGLLPHARDKE